MILLDTNVVSELYRPTPQASVVAWFNAQSNDLLYLCAPVLAELRFGMERLEIRTPKDPYGRPLSDWKTSFIAAVFCPST